MIKRVVLTGGPGTGKTTILNKICEIFRGQEYKVIVIDETATYLIEKGIRCFGEDAIDLVDFQELVMKLQLAKEEIIDRAVEMQNNENVLIIYDRGTIDNYAYMNEDQAKEVLSRLHNTKTFSDLMTKYDLVIALGGSKSFYTTENNKARSESADVALELGKNTLKCWLGHNNLKIVLPKETIEEKINEVVNIINELLQKQPVKRQEKYLVNLTKTDLNFVKSISRPVKIEQTYLQNQEKRLRKIEVNGSIVYYLSAYKKMKDNTKVLVSEKKIDAKVYKELLAFKDEGCEIIKKDRYYFSYNGEYFYLDVFEDNKDLGILEINVGENEKVVIPDFIPVIDNVSNNEKYDNKYLSTAAKRKESDEKRLTLAKK